MDWGAFIDKNANSIIPVIATLGGMIISQLCNILKIRIETKKQIAIKKVDAAIEFEKNHIIEPILSYLDSELKFMIAIYREGLSSGDKAEDIFKPEHILNLSCISARIRALGDETLNEKFDKFTLKRFDIANRILKDSPNRNPSIANKQLQAAEQLAGEILSILKEKIYRN